MRRSPTRTIWGIFWPRQEPRSRLTTKTNPPGAPSSVPKAARKDNGASVGRSVPRMFFLSLKRQLVHQTVGSFGVIRVDRQSTIRALNSHRERRQPTRMTNRSPTSPRGESTYVESGFRIFICFWMPGPFATNWIACHRRERQFKTWTVMYFSKQA